MPSSNRQVEPRRKPRQVRAELTRDRILTAAAHVFSEHGYAAGTTNRIADQARVSIGSLYQYFPNKDAILAELLVRHIDRGRWEQADHLDLSPGSLETVVRALVRDAVDAHRDDPKLLRIMIEEGPFSDEVRSTLARHGAQRLLDRQRTARAVHVADRKRHGPLGGACDARGEESGKGEQTNERFH